MKKVHSSSMVCHLWANQSQSEARNAGNTIFYEGKELYSYRRSFKIGEIIEAPNGQRVYFINSRKYSITTAKHIRNAYRAIPHGELVLSFNFFLSSFGMFSFNAASLHRVPEVLLQEIKNLLLDQCKAISNEWPFIEAQNVYSKYSTLCKLFHFECQPLQSLPNYEKAQAKHESISWKNEVKRQEREAQRLADLELQKLDDLQKLEKWLKNEYHGTLYNIPVHLRLSKDGNKIETTRGANVPVSDAIRLWDIIQRGEHILGQRIGNFTANSVNDQRIRIGCHEIPMETAREFMESLKINA